MIRSIRAATASLYRKESAAQAAISGYEIDAAAQDRGRCLWLAGRGADRRRETVTADVEVLVWSDIVRDSMSNSIPATYRQLLSTAWTYIGSGALWRLMRLRKGPVIAALYPVVFLLVQLALACAVAYGVARLGAEATIWVTGGARTAGFVALILLTAMLGAGRPCWCCAGSARGMAGSLPIT